MNTVEPSRLATEVLFELLSEFGHDPTTLREVMDQFLDPPLPSEFQPPPQVEWTMTLAGDDLRPVELAGSSKNGFFVLDGRNHVGKTFCLIGLSCLLGFPWEQESVARFLRDEQRYLETGKDFVIGLEGGTRRGTVTFEWSVGSFSVSYADGVASLKITTDGSEEERTFNLSEGWQELREAISKVLDVEFIPQNKNFLQRLFQELSSEVLDRMNLLWDALEAHLGETAPSRLELEDKEQRVSTQLDDENAGLIDIRGRIKGLETDVADLEDLLREATDAETRDRMILFGSLLNAKSTLDACRDGFLNEHTEATSRRQQATRASENVIRMNEAWKTIDTVWRKTRDQADDRLAGLVDGLLATRTASDLNYFIETNDFGPHSIYSRIASELRRQIKDSRTEKIFPMKDLSSGEEAFVIDDLARIFEAQAAWARNFARLLPDLETVRTNLSSLDPEEISLTPTMMESRVQDLETAAQEGERRRLEIEKQVRQSFARLPDGLITAPESPQELFERYDQLLADIMQRIDEIVEQLPTALQEAYQGDDADRGGMSDLLRAFPASVNERLSGLRLDKQAEEKARTEAAARIKALERELKESRKQLEDEALLALVDIRESLNSGTRQIKGNLERRAAGEGHVQLTIPLRNREVKLTSSLPAIFGEALRQCCRVMFVFRGGAWVTVPVTRIDCDRWSVEAEDAEGKEILLVNEDPATGIRAALTVLGMAIPITPARIKILCVDEWGEVQKPLSEKLCQLMAEVDNAVHAFFTRPSDSLEDQVNLREFP